MTAGAVRAAALSLLVTLSRQMSLRQFAPRILHALIRILAAPASPPDLRVNALKLVPSSRFPV